MIHDKKTKRYNWRFGLLLVAIHLLSGCGEQRFEPHKAQLFTLPSLDNSTQISLSDFKGDVIYLTFWASWCEPCREEMPYLAQLWQRHHKQGLQVLAINVEEDIIKAQAFAEQYDLPFPLLKDQQREISTKYRVPGFPTHFIIDRSGDIRFSGMGFNSSDVKAVNQEVETLLAEPADEAG